jgi:hypothetical protein
MRKGISALIVLAALCASAGASVAAGTAPSPSPSPASRRNAEAAFLRTVDSRYNANYVTGDLPRYAGKHVAYTCTVDAIVDATLMLGQCGSPDEPVDLYVRVVTANLRVRDQLRVLGVLEKPVPWTDIFGHTVYYAFVRAVFADKLSRS